MSAPSIHLLAPWFGPWPAWMRFFLASCGANPDIRWTLIGDAPALAAAPANVSFLTIALDDYRRLLADRLKIAPRWREAYKVCDVRPSYGLVHADLIGDADFWGYGDLDVVYGDIRSIYTPDVLAHDLVTTHDDVVAGHFSLFRNTPKMNEAFTRIRGWRDMLADDRHRSFDEQIFSRLFLPLKGRQKVRRLITPYLGGGLFQERFSTAIPPRLWIDGTPDWPRRWFWRRGKLTAALGPGREFLYLHFSHWQSDRWTQEARAPWKTLDRLDNCPPGPLDAFSIGPDGFHPLADA